MTCEDVDPETGGMMIVCDGCTIPIPADDAPTCLLMIRGVQMRYCPDCKTEWVTLETAINAETARCQRLADLFALEARQKVALKLTVFDFPQVMCDAQGNPVVLR